MLSKKDVLSSLQWRTASRRNLFAKCLPHRERKASTPRVTSGGSDYGVRKRSTIPRVATISIGTKSSIASDSKMPFMREADAKSLIKLPRRWTAALKTSRNRIRARMQQTLTREVISAGESTISVSANNQKPLNAIRSCVTRTARFSVRMCALRPVNESYHLQKELRDHSRLPRVRSHQLSSVD